MISPQRWARLEPILDRALELPPEEVSAYLDEACGDDPRLRGEVERLLRAGTEEGGLLEEGAAALAAPLLDDAVAEGPAGERRIGPYRVLRELGRGGMGVVHLARDPRLAREVAVKVLPPWLAMSERSKRRFTEEARAASALDHPNIETVHEIGETEDGRLYIVMAYYAGETLAERIGRGTLAVDEALRVGTQVADALAAAHAGGIVHRDVKPSNVILTPEGVPKLVDFGVAKAADHGLTATGATPGTVAYMSPEQTRGEEVDARSDVWSAGVVLYEMLTGERPFAADGEGATIYRIRNDEPRPVRELRPDVPGSVAAVVERCLARDPERRYRDGRALLEALSGAVDGMDGNRPGARRRLSPAAAGLAIFVAAAAAVGVLLYGNAPEGPTADAEAILVMPMAAVGSDTALARLGRELAVALSANLASVARIGTVEALTVLGRIPEDSAPTLERGIALARRLEARSVLHGSLVRDGTRVRLDLALTDPGERTTLAHATVGGSPDDIAALTDSATLSILRQVWRRGEAPVPSLAALTTRSVDALRAYLEGERALARSAFDEAVTAFERAYAADSTFWFALWRSLYPRIYEGTRLDSARYSELIAHRHEFPTPDRLLLESGLKETLSETLAARRALTERFTTYWPGWYALADLLVHWTPYLGTTLEEARVALDEVVELNPEFASAWEHLFWVTIYQRDTTGAARALRELERFGAPGAFQVDQDLLHYYGTLLYLLRNEGAFGSRRLAADADFIATYSGGLPDLAFGRGLIDFDFPRAQVQLGDAVLERRPRRGIAAAMWLGKGLGFAGRGAWDSALVAMDRWVRLSPTGAAAPAPDAALLTYGWAVAGVRLGGLDPTEATGRREAAAASPAAATQEGRAELAWLDGVLAHARGDSGALASARRALRESGSEFLELLDGSLAALELGLAGQPGRAGRELAERAIAAAERQAQHRYGPRHPFFDSLTRLTAAPWLLATGDTLRATALLTWHEAEYWNAQRFLDVVNPAIAPLAILQLARIAQAWGDLERAARHYREFVFRYDMATGERAADVERAIASLRALRTGSSNEP